MSFALHWRLVRGTFILIFLIHKRSLGGWLGEFTPNSKVKKQIQLALSKNGSELPEEHVIFVFILFAKGSLTSPLYFLITASVCRVQTYEDIAHKLSWVETMRNWVIETRASCKKKIHLKNNPRQSLRESFGSLKHGGFV